MEVPESNRNECIEGGAQKQTLFLLHEIKHLENAERQ
jgi:hypothetical protein